MMHQTCLKSLCFLMLVAKCILSFSLLINICHRAALHSYLLFFLTNTGHANTQTPEEIQGTTNTLSSLLFYSVSCFPFHFHLCVAAPSISHWRVPLSDAQLFKTKTTPSLCCLCKAAALSDACHHGGQASEKTCLVMKAQCCELFFFFFLHVEKWGRKYCNEMKT